MGKSTAEEFLITYNKVTGSDLTADEFMDAIDSLNHLFGFDTQKPIAMGNGAMADFGNTDNQGIYIYGQSPPLYGLAGGQYAQAMGEQALSFGMRCTTVGAYAWAGNISATAIGVGAIARSTHALALGRGACCEIVNSTNIGGFSSNDIWFANGQSNFAETLAYPSGPNNPVGASGTNDWTNTWIRLHGPDNADFRITPDAGLENGNGGSIAMSAGRGRGTGLGGKLGFEVARTIGGTASNAQNPLVLAGYFDSATLANRESNFVLQMKGDAGETNHYRRVVAGEADSAGVGFRTLMVANDGF